MNEVWNWAQSTAAWQELKTSGFLSDGVLLHVKVCLFDRILTSVW